MTSDDCKSMRLTAKFFGEINDLGLANPYYLSLVTIYNELSKEVFDTGQIEFSRHFNLAFF